MLFKAGREIKAVGKAAAVSDRLNAEKLIVNKQLLCGNDSHIGQILSGSFSCLSLETASEIVLVKADVGYGIGELKVDIGKVFVYHFF